VRTYSDGVAVGIVLDGQPLAAVRSAVKLSRVDSDDQVLVWRLAARLRAGYVTRTGPTLTAVVPTASTETSLVEGGASARRVPLLDLGRSGALLRRRGGKGASNEGEESKGGLEHHGVESVFGCGVSRSTSLFERQ
jgi:hypothetical protein